MVQLKLFLLIVIAHSASCSIAARDGFVTQRKQWDEVVGRSEEEAKGLVRREFPNVRFVVVPEDEFKVMSEEWYVNEVVLGVSSSGIVRQPAKYFGYVPDFTFAQHSVGKPYEKAVEAIMKNLPSCKIVVVLNGETIFSCCEQQRYDDYVRLEVDSEGLLLHLPVFVPY